MPGDPWPYIQPMTIQSWCPPASPRVMPVNLPFSNFGVTVAVMDSNGNVTIKVDQPSPPVTGKE